jgi:DNA repair exonuclease SbcCD ATPase subunit
MMEKEHLPVKQFILPFSVPSENRKESFTKEMERATIFCLAELERAKGGGIILKQPIEKLAFIIETCYPFWLVPWSETDLLIDGLGTTTSTMPYKAVANVKAFIESIERGSKTQETFSAFLSDNVNYFQTPTNAKEIALNGLIKDPNFLGEFASYISEAKQAEALQSDMVMLPSKIEESSITSMIQELENVKAEFKEDVDALYRSMKLLNATSRGFVKAIRGKVKTVKEEFGKEIRKQENVTLPKVNLINEEYDEQITKLAKDFEKQLLPLHKERVKLEKTMEQTRSKIDHYKIEAKTSATNKDVVGERKWKEKIGETKKEVSEIEAKIREVQGKIKTVEENKSLETFRLRSETEAKIKEAKKDLLELEAARDSKIQIHTQEIEKLEKLTSTIVEQINNTAKMRETNLNELEKLGIKQEKSNNIVVYVPFYVACFKSESKRRYMIFPPSIVNSIGLLAKIKGALGKAKIKQLFVPRFKTITSLLAKFPALIERDAVLERELSEASEKSDILRGGSRGQVKTALKHLKDEGWFSEKEHQAFNQQLQQNP